MCNSRSDCLYSCRRSPPAMGGGMHHLVATRARQEESRAQNRQTVREQDFQEGQLERYRIAQEILGKFLPQ